MGELAARLWVSASPPFYRIGAFMDYKSALGINPQTGANEVGGETLFEYVNMRLSAAGLPVFGKEDDYPIVELAKPLLENYREFSKLSAEYLAMTALVHSSTIGFNTVVVYSGPRLR